MNINCLNIISKYLKVTIKNLKSVDKNLILPLLNKMDLLNSKSSKKRKEDRSNEENKNNPKSGYKELLQNSNQKIETQPDIGNDLINEREETSKQFSLYANNKNSKIILQFEKAINEKLVEPNKEIQMNNFLNSNIK